VKKLHGVAEHHRVSVRNIRRDGNEAVKTDACMEKLDQAARNKEKEIMEIR
jgi:ribosome recycling factor